MRILPKGLTSSAQDHRAELRGCVQGAPGAVPPPVHGIMESQRLAKTFRIINPALPSACLPLTTSPSATATSVLKVWICDSTSALGSLFQGFASISLKNFFPNIQTKSPLAQIEAVSFCPVTRYLGEEADPHLVPASDILERIFLFKSSVPN